MFELPGELNFNVNDVQAEAKPGEDALDVEIRQLFFDEFEAREDEITPGTIDLAGKIKDKRAEITLQQREISALITEKANINTEIDRIQAEASRRIAELTEKRSAIETAIYDRRKLVRDLERQYQALYREMQLAIDEIRNSITFKKNAKQFEIDTAGFKWREFAFSYQIEGAQFLANAHRAILGDDMGLGKTLTLLITMDMLKAKRVLIVCPADQTTNFEREARNWAPHRPIASVYKQPPATREAMLRIMAMGDEFTILINYDSWRFDDGLVKQLCNMGFDTVICDEAHNIKNTSTSAYKGMRDIVKFENCCAKCSSLNIAQVETEPGSRRYSWRCSECGWDSKANMGQYKLADRRSVKNVYPTSGTPILNRPQELFPLLHIILPEIFEREVDFLAVYCEQDWTGYWKFKEGALDTLFQSHIKGRYIARDERRLKEEGIELPNQDVQIHDVDITEGAYPQQYRAIQQLNKHAQIILESGRKLRFNNTLEIILRQRQANVWPGGIKLKDDEGNVIWAVSEEIKESIKLDWAEGLLDKFTMPGLDGTSHRCVVFSQFKDPLQELHERLTKKGIRSVVYDGSTKQDVRQRVQTDFDRKYCEAEGYTPEWDVVLCNYRTGGVGLNFTAATRTIVTDEEWNPGKNTQAWRRTRRIGQTEETQVHIIRLNRTVDTWLARLIAHKAQVVAGFNSAGEEMQAEMLRALKDGDFL